MLESKVVRTKFRLEVEITLIDGSRMSGNLFLNIDERLLDLINDGRAFVPFEDTSGAVSMLSKTTIIRATPTLQNLPVAEPTPLKVAG